MAAWVHNAYAIDRIKVMKSVRRWNTDVRNNWIRLCCIREERILTNNYRQHCMRTKDGWCDNAQRESGMPQLSERVEYNILIFSERVEFLEGHNLITNKKLKWNRWAGKWVLVDERKQMQNWDANYGDKWQQYIWLCLLTMSLINDKMRIANIYTCFNCIWCFDLLTFIYL